MSHTENISADEALGRLMAGNKKYIRLKTPAGNISREIRSYTSEHGQQPYAVIIGCSDSRVIPESIFSAGIGELFVIRVAGNVIDRHQSGSVEYAVEHLGCKLVVVLGHDGCGAVDAAVNHETSGYVTSITDMIKRAAAGETDPYKVCCLNVMQSAAKLKENDAVKENGVKVVGAVYRLKSGRVDFENSEGKIPEK